MEPHETMSGKHSIRKVTTMTDTTLRQMIIDELDWEPSIEAAHIGVAVDKGVVTLTGHVASYAEKHAAERAARRVKGAHAIAEEIEVRRPGAKQTADDQIAKRAMDILAWQAFVPKDRINVKVEKGWVTLTGEIDWFYQKDEAEKAIRKLSGIVGILNRVELKPRLEATDVKKRIENALKRNAEIEAKNIQVIVSGGKVTLEGKVDAWTERERIERTVWSAPGVTSVVDHIAVR
jgi:osmotically-inducible protein OsmY